MKKKIVCAVLFIALAASYMPTCYSTESGYIDVPTGNWAEQYIIRASQLGIMQGIGGSKFGLGTYISRAQFAAMLTRLFGWEKASPEYPSFSDNADPSLWYYADIETALLNGAVSKDSDNFRPDDNITREEMAVMLVRALGYGTLAERAENFGMTFTDVTSNKGYITLASDFGIITGVTPEKFDPKAYAQREQAAAMMIRMYDRKMSAGIWNHAFYAISSYDQRNIISKLDGVSFGWSRLQYSEDGGVFLNTTNSGGNEWNIPSGADVPRTIAKNGNIPENLSVFMSASQTVGQADGTKSNVCNEILLDSARRSEAVRQITEAVNGMNFAGVTIDFEEMRGTVLRDGLNAFLKELRESLETKKIYICVHPKLRGGSYYDAYDFRTIGEICDKVIVMAHDYQAKSMDAASMAQGFTTTPVTPFEDVYYGLKSVTDKYEGVQDVSKIALAISIGSVGWSMQNGAVINSSGMRPLPSDIYKRLGDAATEMYYSERYRNPYIKYYDIKDDTDNIVWYEDTRSINDKIELARMFGITGVSYWRLGLLPEYQNLSGREIYYDVVSSISN